MRGQRVHETVQSKRALIGDPELASLMSKPDGELSEVDFRGALKGYNLRGGLISLGQISFKMFTDRSMHTIGRGGYRDPQTGVIVTQFTLAYLANMLILSGATDASPKPLHNRDNILILIQAYSNKLAAPELQPNFPGFTLESFASFMVRMWSEQMEYQVDTKHIISRSTILMRDLFAKSGAVEKLGNPAEIFLTETGISLEEYFHLAFAIWAGAQQTSTVRIQMFSDAKISTMRHLLTKDKVQAFFAIHKTLYTDFAALDQRLNAGLDPLFTKNRFNPLLIKPIVETDNRLGGDPYVIPNSIAYAKATFGGLYWWFHKHYEDMGLALDFRTFFGQVFEEYVGLQLKSIYGKRRVSGERAYGKSNRFVDWIVRKGDKIYLFEVKAYQFPLRLKQEAEAQALKDEVARKVAKTYKQVFLSINDVETHDELKDLRGMKLIPILVFMDIPLISTDIFKPMLEEALQDLESAGGCDGLTQFKPHMISIEELELFQGCRNRVEIEDVFKAYESDTSSGFLAELSKKCAGQRGNRIIDKAYKQHWKEMVGRGLWIRNILVELREKIGKLFSKEKTTKSRKG